MGIAALSTVRIGGHDHNLVQDAGVIATAGVSGGAAAAMPKLYRAHSGANAPFSTLMKSSVKPALVGGVAAAALAAGLVAFAPEHGDNALMGAAVGGGMGALMFAGNGLSAIGQPVNGRVPSAIRVLAGPIMLGAGIGAAVGLGAGALMGLAGSSDSAERAGS